MQTTPNNNIKIIRLHGGEDIIADYIQSEDEETAILHNPMQVIFKRIPTGQTVMMMMPWLPIEIIKDNHAILYTSDILTIIDPKDSAIKHYGEVVMEAQQRMEEIDVMSEEDDDDEDDEDGVLDTEEIFEALKEKRNKKLH
jgi:hypothetical protein